MDPETNVRFRLKGEIFHEDWTREQSLERALGSEHSQPRKESEDLMHESFQSFTAHIASVLSDAQCTIESDIRQFTIMNKRSTNTMVGDIRMQVALIERITRMAPWMLSLSALILITGLLGMMWLCVQKTTVDSQRWELHQMGLNPVNQNGQTFILLDDGKVNFDLCVLNTRQIPCLVVH